MKTNTTSLNKRILLPILCILVFSEIWAQDHPVPIQKNILGYNNSGREYYEQVNKILLNNLSRPKFQILVLPSFSRGYVIYLEDWDSLVKKTAEEVISKESNPNKITTSEKKVALPGGFGLKLKKLILKVLSETKYPDLNETVIRQDGVSYYLITEKSGFGLLSGKIWSPKEGTKMKDLENIIRLLEEMTDAQDQELVPEVLEQVDRLMARLDPVKFERQRRRINQKLDSITAFLELNEEETLLLKNNDTTITIVSKAIRKGVSKDTIEKRLGSYFFQNKRLEILGSRLRLDWHLMRTDSSITKKKYRTERKRDSI